MLRKISKETGSPTFSQASKSSRTNSQDEKVKENISSTNPMSSQDTNPEPSWHSPSVSHSSTHDVLPMLKPKNHGDQSKNESVVQLPELQHFMDASINWAHVVQPKKTDLLMYVHNVYLQYLKPDLFVKIKYDIFNCNLIVVQCYSSFFSKNTYGETVELPPDRVSPMAFEVLYHWMLQLDQEATKELLNRRNILDVFRAAQHLDIPELEKQCWAFMACTEIFEEDTALLLYIEAKEKNVDAVMDLMVPRIAGCFLATVGADGYDNLPVDVICMLLSSNYVQVHSEAEIFMSGVKWLISDWENRAQDVLEVMRCVRFGFISPWQLVDISRNPESPELLKITKQPEVQKLLDEGMAYSVHCFRDGYRSNDYNLWMQNLSLTEPEQRNWIGEEKTNLSFKQFLKDVQELHQKSLPARSLEKPQPANVPSFQRGYLSHSRSSDKEPQTSSFPTASYRSATSPVRQVSGSTPALQPQLRSPLSVSSECPTVMVQHPFNKKFTISMDVPPEERAKIVSGPHLSRFSNLGPEPDKS